MNTKLPLLLSAFFLLGLPLTSIVRGEVYELRTYTTHEGKLDALNTRFRDHTVRLFQKHGMESVGYWVPTDGEKATNTLIYVLRHESREAAQKSWAAFLADEEWKKVFAESRQDGPLLAKAPDSVFMESTDYSPDWNNKSTGDDAVFELRIYQAADEKLPKLDARFRDHTIRLFSKHGIESVAYWHPLEEPQSKDHLIYIVKHASREAAQESWAAFRQDPDWQKAASESEVGRLAKPPEAIYMKATDYSAIR